MKYSSLHVHQSEFLLWLKENRFFQKFIVVNTPCTLSCDINNQKPTAITDVLVNTLPVKRTTAAIH